MKLVVAIVSKEDAEKTTSALTKAEFRTTRLDSVGGFLKEKNSTILIGVDEKKVDEVLKVIGSTSKSHVEQLTPTPAVGGPGEFYMADPVEVTVGGATVFVLDVDRFERL
jgi:uncharacterized protein YaaQ